MVGSRPREGGGKRGAEGQLGGGRRGKGGRPAVQWELESRKAPAADWMGRCPQRGDAISSPPGAEAGGMGGRGRGLSPHC